GAVPILEGAPAKQQREETAVDVSKAGKVIAEQMGALERDYGDDNDYEIVGTISIVAIQGPEGTNFRLRSNFGHPAMTLGALRMAEDQFMLALRTEGGIETSDGEEDGDD